ncbi:ComF family protein [Natroniella sulfidigena]|uniref:ComF family protein n=1 Tax=Natroniella sulfidigena TaxID=723921 RepID=UPI00200A90E5|nr:ComF family protein [Natroniella sulfidigena]MCK8816037.1 ComF family protein [Natroniella sulfidigena]
MLSRIYNFILDILYPAWPSCPACGREFSSSEIGLCSECIDEIEFIGADYCVKCGKLTKNKICLDCREQERFFSQARAIGLYNKGLKEYIKQFKYDKQQQLAQPLGSLLAKYAEYYYQLNQLDLVTYIPIHKQRLEERGFNQAYLLAKQLNSELRLPIKSLLARVADTARQSELARQERLQNLAGKFRVENQQLIRGQRILLVDDIFTTGATVNEASKLLLEAGAEDVKVITLATGKDFVR